MLRQAARGAGISHGMSDGYKAARMRALKRQLECLNRSKALGARGRDRLDAGGDESSALLLLVASELAYLNGTLSGLPVVLRDMMVGEDDSEPDASSEAPPLERLP